MYRINKRQACAVAVGTSISIAALAGAVGAQEAGTTAPLPDVVVIQPVTQGAKKPATQAPAKKPQPAKPSGASQPAQPTESYEPADVEGTGQAGGRVVPGTRAGSLTVPTIAEAKADIQTTPGGVDLVPAEEYKSSTPATTIKDALDYVPGVLVQPKWGEDTRLSIRGSGLSRNFHLRGVQLYMDGIPINTADGYGDFQEIDPTAYRYIAVYKGANALRFGANSLGGAINFVMPTGYDADLFGSRVDAGSFGFHKLSASSGGVHGAADYFITGTWQEQDGFREHSDGESARGAMNLGYRLTPDIETRFYVNANDVDQRIPGGVRKEIALTSPETAAAGNLINDQQRNIETVRVANKTAIRVGPGTLVELGSFYVDRHLMHPIFQWLDYQYDDYGGFARLMDDSTIGGYRNRLVAGVNLHSGKIDNQQFDNLAGAVKGNLRSSSLDRSQNVSAYLENSFYFLPDAALVAGTQFIHATRDRRDRFFADADATADDSGRTEFDLWSPKVGLLWDVAPAFQVFANVSRSAEVPSFGEASLAAGQINFTKIKPQRATTYEIGTRGHTEDYSWDVALYRANIDDELLCFSAGAGTTCQVANADETVHQGVELGFGVAVVKGFFAHGPRRDTVWLNTAYTYNDFYYDDDALWGDNEIPGAPHHFIRAELLYRHPSGFYAGPNIEWVPEAYFVDSANTFKTEAYAIWGAKMGYDDGGPVSVYLEGRNLSDEAYIASASIASNMGGADGNLFEPGTGRAVYGGVRYRW